MAGPGIFTVDRVAVLGRFGLYIIVIGTLCAGGWLVDRRKAALKKPASTFSGPPTGRVGLVITGATRHS